MDIIEHAVVLFQHDADVAAKASRYFLTNDRPFERGPFSYHVDIYFQRRAAALYHSARMLLGCED